MSVAFRKLVVSGSFVATVALGVSASAKDSAYVYGPPPDWSEYRRLGEAAIRKVIPDPDDWAVEWPNGYIQSYWRHRGRFDGYITCGMVRAIKQQPKGGYPSYPFVVVIDQGQVKTVDYMPHPSNSVVNVMCSYAVRKGRLPPADMMPGAATTRAATVASANPAVSIDGLGLRIAPMPEGAYVIEVADGSPAARGGLVRGMVITRVNGIALAGLDAAMTKVLDAKLPSLVVETATGARLTIQRTP